MPLEPTPLYGARLNFMSDGSITVRAWVWDEARNDRHEMLLDAVVRCETTDEADRIDQAAYLVSRALRIRREVMRARASRAASRRAQAASGAPRTRQRAKSDDGTTSSPVVRDSGAGDQLPTTA